MVFRNKVLQVQDIFEEAKIIAWKWLRTRSKGFVHSSGLLDDKLNSMSWR